jgi:hypothetical protein
MGQPVKVSEELMLDARIAGKIMERSINRQIEYWARLGRAVEALMRGTEALALSRAGAAQPLSELLETVDSPEGRQRLAAYLTTIPYPHYEAADDPRLVTKIDADGTRSLGRFVNREFKILKKKR